MRNLLLVLCFAVLLNIGLCQEAGCEKSDLRCWLQRLEFQIPDQHIEQTPIVVDLWNITCHSLYFGNLTSNTNPTGLEMSLFTDGLGLSCKANYSVTTVLHTLVSGLGDAQFPGEVYFRLENTTADLALSMVRNREDGMGDNATLDRCHADTRVTELYFGGKTGPLLNVTRGVIIMFIEANANKTICSQLDKLVSQNLTQSIRTLAQEIVEFKEEKPDPMPNLPLNRPLVDLRNHSFVHVIDYVLNDLIGTHGVVNINELMNRITQFSGHLVVDDIPLFVKNNTNITISTPVFDVNITNYGTIKLSLDSFDVDGLNTWSDFTFLEPVGPQELISHTATRNLTLNVGISVDILLNGQAHSFPLHESIQIYMDIIDMNMTLFTALAIDRGINNIDGNQFIDTSCLLSQIVLMEMLQMHLDFQLRNFSLLPGRKASTQLLELQLEHFVSDASAFVIGTVGPAVPTILSTIGLKPAQQALNNKLDDVFSVHRTCPALEDPEEGSFDAQSTAIAFGVTMGIFCAIVIYAAISLRGKHSKYYTVEETRLISEYLEGVQVTTEAPSMILDMSIHRVIRYTVPLILLLNAAIFISSNTSTGASVFVFLKTNESYIQLPSTFHFGLENSVHDMWKAHVYALSILIALFSGFWPYLKLALMLACWVFPPKYIPFKHRDRILWVLDFFGKFSLIDSFVLIIMMVAFHFHIAPPTQLVVDAYVIPESGFYLFLIATMMSLIITHVVIYFHRANRDAAIVFGQINKDNENINIPEEEELLIEKNIGIVDEAVPLWRRATHDKSRVQSLSIMAGVSLSLLLPFILVIVGAIVISFDFEFKGAFRLLLIYLNEDTVREFSLITLGQTLSSAALHPNDIGTRFIQITFFIFALVMPLLYMLFMFALWLLPLNIKQQKKIMLISEVWSAWSALEVFVISILAALFQLKQFAKFMIGDACNQINPLLKRYVGEEIMGDDTDCFDVVANLKGGCWLLFASCIIYLLIGNLVMIYCHKVVERGTKPKVSIIN